MALRSFAIRFVLVWLVYAGLVDLWRACGGSFAVGSNRLAGAIVVLAIGTGIGSGLWAGVRMMELVRKRDLLKWQGVLAAVLFLLVSAIAPAAILEVLSSSADQKSTTLNAAIVWFVTLLFGMIACVAFSVGIICSRVTASEKEKP
jgi:hypothetical protein